MRDYVILTDSACDLPEDYVKRNNLEMVNLLCNMNGKIYGGDKKIDIREFYQSVRDGALPTTMAVNPESVATLMKKHLNQGEDILYIAFSSGLSASYQSAKIAASELGGMYTDRKIVVIDSLCASMGQGLLVHKALKMKESGKTMDETAWWLENNKLNLCHQFTVDDLHHLHRGGRISKTTAVLGSIINIKPVLHVDDNGKLVSIRNVRGRKRSIQALVDNMEQAMAEYDEDPNDDIFISHGDCIEDAKYLARLIEERFGQRNFYFSFVGAVIGSHSGPGTLALFHMGKSR